MLVQILRPLLLVFGIVLCFCTSTLTCMKALMNRWTADTVGEHVQQYVCLPVNSDEIHTPDLFPAPGWIPPYHDDENETTDLKTDETFYFTYCAFAI